jgi:AcrR family transcriptional regulator
MATRRSTVLSEQRARRADARRRLLDAALELLDERPWPDILLEDITSRAGVARTSFYRHFDDREQLLLAALGEIAPQLQAVTTAWNAATGTPEERLRVGITGLVEAFRLHGRLLRAASDAATHDASVAEAYRGMAETFIEMNARAIAQDPDATVTDPQEVSRALVWMNERYLMDRFGGHPLGDPERAREALVHVWLRAVYGRAGD